MGFFALHYVHQQQTWINKMSFNLTNSSIANSQVPVNQVVNGYEIEKMEASAWACIKLGSKIGKCFKSKKAAIAYAIAS